MTQPLATRRAACAILAAAIGLTAASTRASSTSRGPLLWRASNGNGTVYLFPFGEAKDGSWFTERVKTAFAASSELWLEVGPPPPKDRVNAIEQELGHDLSRTFFDALTPPVRARALQYMDELDISRESVQNLRPWLAYYTFVKVFDHKYGHSEGMTQAARPQWPPDRVLAEQALKDHKKFGFEQSMEEWLHTLAATSDAIQSQYLQWLFDYFEDEKKGLNRDATDWMHGHLTSRAIDRMRTELPDLYEIMDGRRNRWWAQKVRELLSRGGTYFVAIGQDHFADSHGIPAQLAELGVRTTTT